MSTQVLPALSGLTFDIERGIEWSNGVQESISGKETRLAYWSYARYDWSVKWSFLRSATAFLEFQALWSFVSARQGRYDSFLYSDAEDYQSSAQSLGLGDATNKSFQLVRGFGGSSAIIEPVLAPNSVTRVAIGGTSIGSSQFTVNGWGTTVPGTILLSTAPGNAVAVTADFTYYFPCRFDDDVSKFVNNMSKLWECKKLVFRSIK